MFDATLAERFKRNYGDEFTVFLLVSFAPDPKRCPLCSRESIQMLWIADAREKRGDSYWAKWYLWCEICLKGIYCPPGSYTVPHGEPYVKWGDTEAIKAALPIGLKLIERRYLR